MDNQTLLRILKRSEYKKVISTLRSGFITMYPFISCITLNIVGDQYMFVEFIIVRRQGMSQAMKYQCLTNEEGIEMRKEEKYQILLVEVLTNLCFFSLLSQSLVFNIQESSVIEKIQFIFIFLIFQSLLQMSISPFLVSDRQTYGSLKGVE